MRRLALLPLLLTSLLAAVPAAHADATAPAADPFTATLVDPQPSTPQAAAGRVLVRFDADATASQQQAALADVDGDVSRQLPIPQTKVVELPAGASPQAAAADLEDDAGVRWAQPDYRVTALATPSDPLFSQLWGMQKISAPQAWDIATGSTSTVVAVVDTGVDLTNPELASELVAGHDWVDGDNTPQDQHGHGTHVSGTIGGIANNGIGVAGVNWRVSIMPLRVLNAQGSGWTSDIASAFSYAGQHGAKVVSASLGGGGDDPALHDAIAQNPNTLYVIAAGNSSQNNDVIPTWPCNVKAANEICVAATDSNDNLASFSSYGASTVQIAAPGVGILSTLPNGQYAAWNGTSMATPHVSGAAALLFSAKPSATVAEVRAAILNGADRLPQLTGKVSTGGRLNVFKALQLLGAKPLPIVTTGAAQGATTTSVTLTGTVDGRGETTTYHFDYGTTTTYGQHTDETPLSGSGGQPVSAAVSGLLAGQALHFRLVATSPGGTVNGTDVTTATTTAPPDVATGAASGVSWRAATLAGTVNPQGLATTWHLDYGRTAAYGSRTADATLPAGSWSTQAVTAALTTLRAGDALPLPGRRDQRRRHDERRRRNVPDRGARRAAGEHRRCQQRRGHRRGAGRLDRPLGRAHALRLPVRPDPGLRGQHGAAVARRRRRLRGRLGQALGPVAEHALPLPGASPSAPPGRAPAPTPPSSRAARPARAPCRPSPTTATCRRSARRPASPQRRPRPSRRASCPNRPAPTRSASSRRTAARPRSSCSTAPTPVTAARRPRSP